MTTRGDLDRSLVAWFEDRAVATAPPDLLDRSLARVAGVRQRGAWRFAGNAFGLPSAFGPMPTPSWLIAVLIVLLVGALVVVGNGLLRRSQLLVPEPSTSIPPPASLEVSPRPSPTALPGTSPTLGMFATIRGVVAAGDQVAWVTTNSAIYRTDDTGKTWRAVQPAGWNPNSAAFPGADTAYVSIGVGSEIAWTHDGGASWSTTTLDAPGSGYPVIVFASPTTGFVTFVDPSHEDQADGTGLLVFATTDGGATWAGPAPGLQPHFDASSNKLYGPLGSFLLSSSGLSAQFAFENWFNLSEDGGATYTRYPFPSGALARKRAMKTVDAIVRGDDGHLVIALHDDDPVPEVVYRNGDSPSAWTEVTEIPGPGDQPFQFLSATTWIVTEGAPTQVISTTDGGNTLHTVIPNLSLYGVQAGNIQASWGSLRTGWATEPCRDTRLTADGSPRAGGVACPNDGRDAVLILTTDGGATWEVIG
jgi:photosystem II stability/assembly factor-like uncharacterized protein